jgi:hypothetical protein
MAQERVLSKDFLRPPCAENTRFYEPRDMFQNQSLAELRPRLPKHGLFLHRRFDGLEVIAVDTSGGGYGLTSRRREAHQRMTGETLTIDIAAFLREGDQLRTYTIEGSLRAGHVHPQPYDVPEKEKHDSERSNPAQHRALRPSEKGFIPTQEFP